ncbi:MAG TPA: hypothetical protein VF911_18275 [Thermoanaerobaculia bacterium]|jgi:predicted nucleic acid-binding Zn ribbon protein
MRSTTLIFAFLIGAVTPHSHAAVAACVQDATIRNTDIGCTEMCTPENRRRLAVSILSKTLPHALAAAQISITTDEVSAYLQARGPSDATLRAWEVTQRRIAAATLSIFDGATFSDVYRQQLAPHGIAEAMLQQFISIAKTRDMVTRYLARDLRADLDRDLRDDVYHDLAK